MTAYPAIDIKLFPPKNQAKFWPPLIFEKFMKKSLILYQFFFIIKPILKQRFTIFGVNFRFSAYEPE